MVSGKRRRKARQVRDMAPRSDLRDERIKPFSHALHHSFRLVFSKYTAMCFCPLHVPSVSRDPFRARLGFGAKASKTNKAPRLYPDTSDKGGARATIKPCTALCQNL